MAQLVQGPTVPGDFERAVLEEVLGSFVGQPAPAGDRAEVDRGGRAGGGGTPCRPGRSGRLRGRRSGGVAAERSRTGSAASRCRLLCVTIRRRLLSTSRSDRRQQDRTSSARAAVSYSSLHRHFSRMATSSRRNSRSSDARRDGFGPVVGLGRRRSSTAAGSSAIHPLRRAKAVKERRVATWRFHVAGAHRPRSRR